LAAAAFMILAVDVLWCKQLEEPKTL